MGNVVSRLADGIGKGLVAEFGHRGYDDFQHGRDEAPGTHCQEDSG